MITGVTGFIGSHLARRLIREGWQVVGVKRSTSELSRLKDILDQLRFHDIDRQPLSELGSSGLKPEAVLHFATDYGRSSKGVSNIVKANTVFPLELLELAIALDVEIFINADTCYTTEYQHLQAYTLSKKQFVQWAQLISKNIKFINLVLQHPYGPGDSEAKFVPFIIKECLRADSEIPLTSGEQKKDFIYIDDVISAVMLLLDKVRLLTAGYSGWECGSGNAMAVCELVKTVHRLTSSTSRLNFGALSYRPGENMHSQADITKLEKLGWKPTTGIEEGLTVTIKRQLDSSCKN